MKRRVSVDFDGVLNEYDGFEESNLGCPKPFAKDFLKKLHDEYEVVIFSCRTTKSVIDWLLDNDMYDYVDMITNEKTPSIAYIDDRAIQFRGDYNKTLNELDNFKTYWEDKVTYVEETDSNVYRWQFTLDCLSSLLDSLRMDAENNLSGTLSRAEKCISDIEKIKEELILSAYEKGMLYAKSDEDDIFDLEEED